MLPRSNASLSLSLSLSRSIAYRHHHTVRYLILSKTHKHTLRERESRCCEPRHRARVSPSGIGLFVVVVFILLLSSCRSHLPPSVPLSCSLVTTTTTTTTIISLSLLRSHRHQNNVQIIINNENVIALGSVARSIVGSRCGDPHERHCLLCCWRWCCASDIARTRYSLLSLTIATISWQGCERYLWRPRAVDLATTMCEAGRPMSRSLTRTLHTNTRRCCCSSSIDA